MTFNILLHYLQALIAFNTFLYLLLFFVIFLYHISPRCKYGQKAPFVQRGEIGIAGLLRILGRVSRCPPKTLQSSFRRLFYLQALVATSKGFFGSNIHSHLCERVYSFHQTSGHKHPGHLHMFLTVFGIVTIKIAGR